MGGMLHYQVDWRSLTGSPIDLDAHAFDAWDCHVFLGVFFLCPGKRICFGREARGRDRVDDSHV